MSGIFARALAKESEKAEKRDFEVVLQAWRENSRQSEGIVTPDTSMRMAAVFACVRILAETVASLPLITYERLERGKKRANDFYLYELLHDRPNSRMTAFDYREVIQSHMTLWGNAYSRIVYDSQGRIEELWPLHPSGMVQTQVRNGVKYYQFQDPNLENSVGQKPSAVWYSEAEIWHLHGLGDDGERGYSPISLMRRAVRLGLSAEEFGDRFFENDARPGIVIEHPAQLSPDALKNLRESWADSHEGVRKSHKPAVLEEGMKLHEIGIPPEDAQFLETRKFQVQEIARIFRVPPHMLADLDRATFSNIEQQSIEFVEYSIRPWLVRWEQSIQQNLMLPDERRRYYAEHLVDGLLRGDVTSRYQSYAIGKQWGWLSTNDIRDKENMNPVENGDEYLVPLNMGPAGAADGPSAATENGNEEDGSKEGGGDGATGN